MAQSFGYESNKWIFSLDKVDYSDLANATLICVLPDYQISVVYCLIFVLEQTVE